MTTDETTFEKVVEKALFEKLKDDPAVLEQTQRLEILVLRESDEDTKILMFGEIKDGGIVDTARVEMDLTAGWKTKEIPDVVEALAEKFKDTLENVAMMSKLDVDEDEHEGVFDIDFDEDDEEE